MAKSNPSFEKRIREQKKRAKKAEKARRKAERLADKRSGGPDEDDLDASAPGDEDPELD